MSALTRTILIICMVIIMTVGVLIKCLFKMAGEKQIEARFIKGFILRPDTYGDDVLPIVRSNNRVGTIFFIFASVLSIIIGYQIYTH